MKENMLRLDRCIKGERGPFAVPEIRVSRYRSADFDRGTHLSLAVSATGGARERDPSSLTSFGTTAKPKSCHPDQKEKH